MISKLKNIYEKRRELILYVFFGGLTTGISFITLLVAAYLFERFSPDFLGAITTPAAVVSWLCAVTFAFFVNKIFVFRNISERKRDWFKQAAMFYGARVATLAFEIAFLLVTVDWLGFNLALMKIVEQVFIVIGNYLLSKFLIFRKKGNNSDDSDISAQENEPPPK
jgi:putative flippase GtrA